jgi:tetratricopeptide (TPR) repeat protein
MRGYVLWEIGRPDAAASALAEAVRVEPQEPRALRTFAWYASVVGRSDEALHAAERAVELEPELSDAWFAMGWACWSKQDWEKAESALLRCRNLDPSNSNWHNNLGALYAKLGKLEEASSLFRAALSIDPRSRYAYQNLAKCLRRLERWEEAAEIELRNDLNRLHDADTRVNEVGDFYSWISRTYANGSLRRFAAAAEDLDRAAQLARTSWEIGRVKRVRMIRAADAGRLQEASELAHELLEHHSDDSAAVRALAEVAWLAGNQPLAERAVDEARRQELGEQTESICRFRAALAVGRWRAALDEFQAQLTARPLASLLCCEHTGAAYASQMCGDVDSARKYLRTAVDHDPNCNTLRLLDRLDWMPVRELLPAEIQPWVLREQLLA